MTRTTSCADTPRTNATMPAVAKAHIANLRFWIMGLPLSDAKFVEGLYRPMEGGQQPASKSLEEGGGRWSCRAETSEPSDNRPCCSRCTPQRRHSGCRRPSIRERQTRHTVALDALIVFQRGIRHLHDQKNV